MLNESSKDRWLLIVIFLAMSIIPGFLLYTKIKENIDKGSIPVNFSVTELVSDNLPDSIEFWTTAYCPDAGTNYDYTVPQGYKVSSCVYGGNGSHGGCPGCVMTKIKLVKIEAEEYHEEATIKEELSVSPDILPPVVLSPEEGYIFNSEKLLFITFPSIESAVVHFSIFEDDEYSPYAFKEGISMEGSSRIISGENIPFKDGKKYAFAARTCLDEELDQCGGWTERIHFSIKKEYIDYQTIEGSEYTIKIPKNWKEESAGGFNGFVDSENYNNVLEISLKRLTSEEEIIDAYNSYQDYEEFYYFITNREIKNINDKTFYLIEAIAGMGPQVHKIALVPKNDQEFFEISLMTSPYDYNEEIFDTMLNSFIAE